MIRLRRHVAASATVLVGLLFLASSHASGSSAFDSEGWKRFREIQIPRTVEAGLVGVALESAVVESCRPDLADLRVVSSTGEVVPLTTTDSFHADDPTPFPTTIYKLVKRPGKWTDLWIDKRGKILSRGLIVQTGSTDFVRKVEIRGSDNGIDEYVILMDGLVFDLPGSVPVRSLDLSHQVNNFRYIHLRFLDGDHPPLKLDGALCCPPRSPFSAAKNAELRVMENRTGPGDNSTVLIADLGEKRAPFSGIKISTPAKGFVKKVRLLGGAAASGDSWQAFHEGTVFRIQRLEAAKENLEVRFDSQLCRYLMVELSGPGQVVPVKSLEVVRSPRLALFEFRPDLTYRLFYDNPQARAEVSEHLSQSLSVSRALSASGEITLGEEQKSAPPPRPKAMAPRKEARRPLFWKIAGMSLLLVGLLLLFSLMLKARSQRRAERRRGSRLMDTRL